MSRQLICNRCKAVSGTLNNNETHPKEWKKVTYTISGSRQISHDVCPNCSSELGFNKDPVERTVEKIESTLYKIILEMVDDAIDEDRQ